MPTDRQSDMHACAKVIDLGQFLELRYLYPTWYQCEVRYNTPHGEFVRETLVPSDVLPYYKNGVFEVSQDNITGWLVTQEMLKSHIQGYFMFSTATPDALVNYPPPAEARGCISVYSTPAWGFTQHCNLGKRCGVVQETTLRDGPLTNYKACVGTSIQPPTFLPNRTHRCHRNWDTQWAEYLTIEAGRSHFIDTGEPFPNAVATTYTVNVLARFRIINSAPPVVTTSSVEHMVPHIPSCHAGSIINHPKDIWAYSFGNSICRIRFAPSAYPAVLKDGFFEASYLPLPLLLRDFDETNLTSLGMPGGPPVLIEVGDVPRSFAISGPWISPGALTAINGSEEYPCDAYHASIQFHVPGSDLISGYMESVWEFLCNVVLDVLDWVITRILNVMSELNNNYYVSEYLLVAIVVCYFMPNWIGVVAVLLGLVGMFGVARTTPLNALSPP